MAVRTTADKEALAAEAWQPLAHFFMQTIKHRQRVFGELGLTPNDGRALLFLDPQQGRSMSELAEAWVCDASNATWIVDRLEERGLAERRTISTDRRVKQVVLTRQGVRMRERLHRAMLEPPAELLEMSSEDLVALRNAVATLPAFE